VALRFFPAPMQAASEKLRIHRSLVSAARSHYFASIVMSTTELASDDVGNDSTIMLVLRAVALAHRTNNIFEPCQLFTCSPEKRVHGYIRSPANHLLNAGCKTRRSAANK
jgi:hypothetical protein